MRKKPARFILLSTLLVSFSCRADDGVSPVALDNEAEGRFYSVSLDPVNPSGYAIIIGTDQCTKFFLNESSDTVIMNTGDSAIGYSGLVEVETDGGNFKTTDAGATFYTSETSPSLLVTFYDPLATEEESVSYNFVKITAAERMQGGATYVSTGLYDAEGKLTKGRLGRVVGSAKEIVCE